MSIRAMLTACMAAAFLTGCGGDGDTPAKKPTTATATSQQAVAINTTDRWHIKNDIKREKLADGTVVVSSAELPKRGHDPLGLPGYTTGDWLVSNLTSEPAVITPLLDKDYYGSQVQQPVIESLITRDEDTFEWQPWLAESWQQKPDNVTFVFKIRKNATFSDGTPVTADDVVFSYTTMMDKGIDDDRYKASGSRIDSCKKIDDLTVEFKFKEPYFQALETAGSIGVIPEHVYKYKTAKEYNDRAAVLVGSGPYMFNPDAWQRGQKITLVRNPTYWGPKGTFDKIVYVFITNPQAAFQAFQAGTIDENSPNPEQWTKFSADADFKSRFNMYKYDRPNSGYMYIGWNEKNAIFADAKTRTAMTMLTDRDTLIETVMRGLAHPITGPFSFMSPQNDATIAPIPFDPKGARKLLDEAGWKLNANNVLVRNGVEFRFELSIPSDLPTYQQIAETLKTQFGKAGIIMRITPYEFSVLVDRLDNRNFDSAMLGWTGGVEEDPYQIWHTDSIKDKGSNFISWSNPAADKLIDDGRREMDDAKRMEIWHKLHRAIHDDQPYTFLWIRTQTVFLQQRFENTDPYKLGLDSNDWYVPAGKQKYK